MIPLILVAITHHFKETSDVELRFNHRSSNAYRTQVYDVFVDDNLLLSSLRIAEMILDFRKETRWSDDHIQAEMTTILISYITTAMNRDELADETVTND
jgi:hypothetical protein